MFCSRMLCALLIWMVLGTCQPSYAQSAQNTDLAPAPAAPAAPAPVLDVKTQAQPGQQELDADAQTQLRLTARRLWQDVLAKKKAGQRQEARAAYVLYLNAAYTATENRWLLLELGRTLEQLGQSEDALRAYRRYLVETAAEQDKSADRLEAEAAVERLAGVFMRKMNIPIPSSPQLPSSPQPLRGQPLNGLTKAGLITLSAGLAVAAISATPLVTLEPASVSCNPNQSRDDCIGDALGRGLFQVLLIGISITGGVAAMTGGVLLLAGQITRAPRSASRAAAVSLTPDISPTTVGLLAAGRF